MFRCALVGLLISVGLAAQQRKQSEIDLQAAIRLETVDGDLNGAITQYKQIVEKYAKTDRATAAAALLQIADCSTKLGNVDAPKIYQRLATDFADQPAGAVARARLRGTAPA
jgi:TolA-binding protein